jgi:UPF0716 protein FxsA
MKWIVAFLIVVPALEIGILIYSGKLIGVIPTVLLIILTGVIGAYLAKQQGLYTLKKAQQELRYGNIPGDAIIDGLCILVGGVVLLTPGFITDTIGFLLLFPATRKVMKPLIHKFIKHFIDQNRITIYRP